MRHLEKVTPVVAAVSAVSTVVCCLPLGFAGAAALGTVAAVVAPLQAWFIGASVALLLIGVGQIARPQRTCRTRTTSSLVILGLCAVIVLAVVFFPQVVAGIAADWLP